MHSILMDLALVMPLLAGRRVLLVRSLPLTSARVNAGAVRLARAKNQQKR
jgi:hypothetical protein